MQAKFIPKVIRTGDVLTLLTNGTKGIVHYVVEYNGQLSFESIRSNIKSLIFDNGKDIIEVPINDVKIMRS